MNRFSLRALAQWWRRRRTPLPSPTSRPPLPRGIAERFTIVTSAYDTKPEFLRELAASFTAQDAPGASWVIADNGSKSAVVRACLDELAQLPRVRLVRVAENRGILGGSRLALEAATSDFVIPVDSDDLLAPHTIRALGHAVLADAETRFLFSDEDHCTDGKRCNPFFRTGWDPALALACSYIWHLCAFDRREALRLGVYADPGANYCHDWDTLLRFVRAGHRPRHVREILYSWRTHATSTTNNATEAHQGSLASQRHVLDLHLRERGLADRFVVADCPLWRGAPELRLERLPVAVPAIDLCVVTNGPVTAAQLDLMATAVAAAAPIRRRLLWGVGRGVAAAGWEVVEGGGDAMLRQLAAAAPFGVLLWDLEAAVREADAARELIGWLELVPEVAVVGGRVLDAQGHVRSAGYYPGRTDVLLAPDEGRRSDDAGYLAMALKPRSVAAVPSGCVLLRGAWLAQAAQALAGQPVEVATLVPWLGAAAAATGMRTVCTPFVTVQAAAATVPVGPAATALRTLAGDQFTAFAEPGIWYGAHRAP